MEEERIALVLSIAKNSGAAKGGARVESLEVAPHASAKDPHYAARTSGAPTLVFVPTSDWSGRVLISPQPAPSIRTFGVRRCRGGVPDTGLRPSSERAARYANKPNIFSD